MEFLARIVKINNIPWFTNNDSNITGKPVVKIILLMLNKNHEPETSKQETSKPESSSPPSDDSDKEGKDVKKRKKDKKGDDEEDAFEVVEDTLTRSSEEIIVPGPVRKKPLKLFNTREISRGFGREQFLIASVREAFLYILFLIIMGIISFGRISPSLYYYTKAMHAVFTTPSVTTPAGTKLSFYGINSMDDVWTYMEQSLISAFYWNFWYNPETSLEAGIDRSTNLMYENVMIGRARIRQVRVHNDSCSIPSTAEKMGFHGCYDEFSSSNEDRDPFGRLKGTAWTYSSASDLNGLDYSGLIATYCAGGYYLDLEPSLQSSNSSIRQLKENLWLDKGTRVVFVEFTLYNANVNLFCIMKLVFEFPPTGGVVPTADLTTQRLLRYHTAYDFFILACEIAYTIFFIYYAAEEFYEMFYFKWDYVKSFWNWIDLLLVIASYVMIAASVYEYVKVEIDLPPLVNNRDIHPNFDGLSFRHNLYGTTLAIILFLCWLKLLKYLTISETMNQLQLTIQRCFVELAIYSLIFIVLFIGFCNTAQLLFGSELEAYKTFGDSAYSLLSALVGNFNYRQLELISYIGIFAPLFFVSYLVVMYFTVINMFIAILLEAFTQVRNEAITRKPQMHIGDLLNKWSVKMLHKIGLHKMAEKRSKKIQESQDESSYKDIRKLLMRCGYNDLEIGLFFAKYDIRESRQISEEEMQRLLQKIDSLPLSGPRANQAITYQEYKAIYDKMSHRIGALEETIIAADSKVNLIISRVNQLQPTGMPRRHNKLD